MARKLKSKPCYLCGEAPGESLDHVPPRCLFPEAPEGSLITVPVHKACEAAFAQDDVLLRDLLAAIGSFRSPQATAALQGRVRRSWQGDPGAHRRFGELLTETWVRDPTSGIEFAHPALNLPTDLADRQMLRFAKGLFYNRIRRPFPAHRSATVRLLHTTALDLANQHLPWRVVEPGIFRHCIVPAHDDAGLYCMFVFFETTVFQVLLER